MCLSNQVYSTALGTGEDANKVTLTLASSTVNGTQYRVFVSNANSTVKDLAVPPNLVDTNAAIALFIGTDKTAPTLISGQTEIKDAANNVYAAGDIVIAE